MSHSLEPKTDDPHAHDAVQQRTAPEAPAPYRSPTPHVASMLSLQQSAGNAAVQRLLHPASALGAGAPLEAGVRQRMEGTLGERFDGVRVHAGPDGARATSAVGARAFALGRDIAFAPAEYDPGSPLGDALIAHELAHVVQQRDAAEAGPGDPSGLERHSQVAGDQALEADADATTVAATGSLWSRATGALSSAARRAVPRLRSGLQLQACKSAAPAAPPRVTADRVELGGGHPMVPALGDTKANPLWTPGATDHAAAFTKGASPAVNARFTLGPGFTMPDAGVPATDAGTAADGGTADGGVAAAAPGLMVRVKEGGSVRGEGPATKAGSTVTVANLALGGLTAGNVMGTRHYQFDWEASTDGGAAWTPVVTTGDHMIHWLIGAPLDSPARSLAVAKAARYADGAADAATAAAKIRSGIRRIDGLTYNPADAINPDPLTVLGDGVGICTDYGNLLTLLARTAGLNANVVMFWGGFESLGRNVWVTVAGSLTSLVKVKSPDPAYNPLPPADGWAFTYHAISRIEGVLHDAALDRDGIDGEAVHDGKVIHLAEGDPAGPPGATKGTAYSAQLPRKPHTVALTIRDYGPQLTLPMFGDVFAVGVAPGAASPVDVPVMWSVAAGALPAGLTLDAFSGVVSGTPTAAGSFPVTITIFASAVGNPMFNTYPVTINVAP